MLMRCLAEFVRRRDLNPVPKTETGADEKTKKIKETVTRKGLLSYNAAVTGQLAVVVIYVNGATA